MAQSLLTSTETSCGCTLACRTPDGKRHQNERDAMTPIQLFCGCGYPVLVRAHWTGQDIVLLLYPGEQTPEHLSEPLTHCPECGAMLSPATLSPHSSTSNRRSDEPPAIGKR